MAQRVELRLAFEHWNTELAPPSPPFGSYIANEQRIASERVSLSLVDTCVVRIEQCKASEQTHQHEAQQATPTEEPPKAQHMEHRTGNSHGIRTVEQLIVQFMESVYGIKWSYKFLQF